MISQIKRSCRGMGLLMALLFLPGRVVAADRVSVQLLNGEKLTGNHVVQQDGYTYLDVPWHAERVMLETRLVHRISFGRRPVPEPKPLAVTLNNGDRFNAELKSLTDSHLVLRTAWAETLKIKRHAVAHLFHDDREVLLSSIGAFEQWSSLDQPFNNQSRTGYVESTESTWNVFGYIEAERRVPHPKGTFSWQARVSFDGMNRSIVKISFGRLLQNKVGDIGLSFYITPQSLTIRHTERGFNSGYWRLDTAGEILFDREAVLRFDVVETAEGLEGRVSINDELITKWDFDEGTAFSSRENIQLGLMLQAREGSGTLSDLKMWKGSVVDPEPESERNTDRLQLVNGDVINGKVKSWSGEKLVCYVPDLDADLTLHQDQVAYVQFQERSSSGVTRRSGRDVRLEMRGGQDQVVGRLVSITKDQAVLESDDWEGPLSVALDHIDVIMLNLYTYPLESKPVALPLVDAEHGP